MQGFIYCVCMCAQSRPTFYNRMDYSSSGSSVHGICPEKILEWVAMPSSRGLSDPGIEPTFPVSPALQADSLPLSHLGSHTMFKILVFISRPRGRHRRDLGREMSLTGFTFCKHSSCTAENWLEGARVEGWLNELRGHCSSVNEKLWWHLLGW